MRELMKKRIEKHFPDDQEFILRDPLLFGDYRNAMKEGESRMYEDLLDYDAVFYLFQEVSLLALNFSSRNQIKAKHYIALPV